MALSSDFLCHTSSAVLIAALGAGRTFPVINHTQFTPSYLTKQKLPFFSNDSKRRANQTSLI